MFFRVLFEVLFGASYGSNMGYLCGITNTEACFIRTWRYDARLML